LIPLRFSLWRRALAILLAVSMVGYAASCGTLIHPDRIGQPHRGRLDTSIVLLDALGLLLFFVPGVVAFVVDFSTGAIFLPAYECGRLDGAERRGDFVVVRVDPKTLTRERIEEIVRGQTGKSVRLEPGVYEARQIEQLDDFDAESESLAKAPAHRPSEVTFRAQSM
jgi:hypothetical protein